MSLRAFLGAALAVVMLGLATAPGSTESGYPSHPIKIVVPFPPGGGVDTLGRLLAEKLQERLGVPVIVENRAGGSGTIGGGTVQQSSPDGYTLLFSSNTHSMTRLVMSKPPYDPLADFTSIARIGEAPLLTVMSPKMPQKTLGEVAKAARENPDRWTAGIPALGSPSHIATISFMHLAKVALTISPYRGTAPALTDVAGGHIQLLTDSIVMLLPMARSGQVKGLAVTMPRRSSLAPEIPTAAESGLPGLEVISWYGLWGPKGIPNEIVKRLNAASADAMRELASAGKLGELGVEPVFETPEQFVRHTAAEVARNAELLKSVEFQPQ